MPAISLVVCLHREPEMLERLLSKSTDCFDDLVVVHDGPEQFLGAFEELMGKSIVGPLPIDYSDLVSGSPLPDGYISVVSTTRMTISQELTGRYRGQYFEGPRSFQQEPHWPFAWSRARHDWILRLDADEFPGDALKEWLSKFRRSAEVASGISGYTCRWPLWNGQRATTTRWPAGRIFLFHRKRIQFIGMAEATPIPEGRFEALPMSLEHQPKRKSHGISNVLFRKQSQNWRRVIASSLQNSTSNLPRWRWSQSEWPEFWQQLRRYPLRTGTWAFIRGYLATLRDQLRYEHKFLPLTGVSGPLHHLLIGLKVHQYQRRARHAGKSLK